MRSLSKLLKLALLAIATVATAHAQWWGYLEILAAGGNVQDPARTENEAMQYLQALNKLNLSNANGSNAAANFALWQAMERTFGDGAGVPEYQPPGISYSLAAAQQIAAFQQALPSSTQGQYLTSYLSNQSQRRLEIQAYAARVQNRAAAYGQSSLTLEDAAKAANEIEGMRADNRLLAIQEQAEADSVHARQRSEVNRIRNYRIEVQEVEAAMAPP